MQKVNYFRKQIKGTYLIMKWLSKLINSEGMYINSSWTCVQKPQNLIWEFRLIFKYLQEEEEEEEEWLFHIYKKKTLNSFLTSSGEESQGLAENGCFIFTFCGGNLANKSIKKMYYIKRELHQNNQGEIY